MSATIVDGKAIAAELREELAAEIVAMTEDGSRPPSLAVVLCGDDPASALYVRNKGRAAERVGIHFMLHRPPGTSTTAELVDLVRELDADDEVDGILVQVPLPSHIDEQAVTRWVSPREGRRRVPPVQPWSSRGGARGCRRPVHATRVHGTAAHEAVSRFAASAPW